MYNYTLSPASINPSKCQNPLNFHPRSDPELPCEMSNMKRKRAPSATSIFADNADNADKGRKRQLFGGNNKPRWEPTKEPAERAMTKFIEYIRKNEEAFQK
jgi:hypothetical protein